MIAIGVLGAVCTAVSLLKAFALPKYRALRGLLFLVRESHILMLILDCLDFSTEYSIRNT